MAKRRIAELTSSRSMKPVCLKSYNLKVTARNSPLISTLLRSRCKKRLSDMQKKNVSVSELKPLLVYHPRGTLGLQWILSSTGAFG
jgi:hypothetical protein